MMLCLRTISVNVVLIYKAYGINAGSIPACFTMHKHKQQLFIN